MTSQGPRFIFSEHSYSVHSASISANEESSKETEKLDEVICRFLQEQHVPGATLAVAKQGRIVYQQGYGLAGAGRKMKGTTPLRVASISKPITAIAVVRLCQEKRLSLDDKVFGARGLLKQLKMRGDKRLCRVTVRHLLQHCAGWDRDMAGDAVFWQVPPPAGVKVTSSEYNACLLQYVLNRKLQFAPGSRHAYSNLGYLVLGEVVEAVTGRPYQDYVTSLLAELGITGMFVGDEMRVCWGSQEGEYFNIKEPATATSVMPGQDDSQVLPQYGSFLMRNTGAFGGWVATAADVLTLLCSLETGLSSGASDRQPSEGDTAPEAASHTERRPTLLNPQAIQTMLERPSFESGRNWYGLGLDVQDGGATWGHTGAMEGTCGTVQRHHSGMAWAFLLNAWATDIDLDGVVKLALSSVQYFSPFPLGMASVCGEMICVRTKDERQCVLANVPHDKLQRIIDEKKLEGYRLVWAGVNAAFQKREKDLTFNLIFSNDIKPQGDRKILLDMDVKHLQATLDGSCSDGFQPELITTYVHDDKMLALAILSPADWTCIQTVDIALPAEDYVQLLNRRRKNGFSVLSQCVSQWHSHLVVTAIMVKRVKSDSVCTVEQLKTKEVLSKVQCEGCVEQQSEECRQVNAEEHCQRKIECESQADPLGGEDCYVHFQTEGNVCVVFEGKKKVDASGSKWTKTGGSKQVATKCDGSSIQTEGDTNMCTASTGSKVTQAEIEGSTQTQNEHSKCTPPDGSNQLATITEGSNHTQNEDSKCTPPDGSNQLATITEGSAQTQNEHSKCTPPDGSNQLATTTEGSNHTQNEDSKCTPLDGSNQLATITEGSNHTQNEHSKCTPLDGNNQLATITEGSIQTYSGKQSVSKVERTCIDKQGSDCSRHHIEGRESEDNTEAARKAEIISQTESENRLQTVVEGKKKENENECSDDLIHRLSTRKRKLSSILARGDFFSPVTSRRTKGRRGFPASLLQDQTAQDKETKPPMDSQTAFQSFSFSSVQEGKTEDNATPSIAKPKQSRKFKPKPSSPNRTLSWVQMSVDSFVAELGRQARHRSGLRNVHFYPADGDWFVSGVWSPQVTHNCYHRMAVSHLGLLPALAEAAANNVRLRFLCQYEEEGALYFALFWDALQETGE